MDKAFIAVQDILQKNSEYKSTRIYQYYVDPETQLIHEKWRHSVFFTIELHSALRPKDGDNLDWEKDPEALLFTDTDQLKELKGIRIWGQSGGYAIVEHANQAET